MKKIFVYSLLSMMVFYGLLVQSTQVEAESVEEAFGDMAFRHVMHFTQEIGERVAGTAGEEEARDYIYQVFEGLGYETEVQPFSFTNRGSTVESANVVAVKPGRLNYQIIIGAHYDTVRGVEGVDDNASGVGVMLEVAERIKDIETPYTVRFIAFGAEEVGLVGSNHYVSEMSESDIHHTKAMINLDSLVAGDYMYVYGGSGEAGWVRELALNISEDLGIGLQTNPGLNPNYPEGTTGNWSDHAAFNRAGIPYGYLESTNWEIGDLDGYTQTEKHGAIWHDPDKDNLEFIQSAFPERMDRLRAYSHILTEWTRQLVATEPSSVTHLKRLVDYYNETGEFESDDVARSLSLHLTAVNHFAERGLAEKVVKHMEGFNLLLEHQRDNALISEKAYHILKADSEPLMKKWQ